MKIAPSILSADYLNLETDIQKVVQGQADLLHVDIMDGHFVPNLSFGPGLVKALKQRTNLPLDVHLMIEQPELLIDQFIQAKPDLLEFHIESTVHSYLIIQKIHQAGLKAGIVLNPATPLESIVNILPIIDQVLIMTVNPGFGGQTFIEGMMRKVKRLDQLRQTNSDWHFEVEVDGGINVQTAKIAAHAGADILVAGSAVFNNSDPALRIQQLRAAALQ